MYDRSGNGTGSSEVKIRTNTAKFMNMIIARFRESRYLVRESEVFIKDKTKVASRVSSSRQILVALELRQKFPFHCVYESSNRGVRFATVTAFHLSAADTCILYLPWEIQNSHFSTVLLIETSDYYIISEETNCNCCAAAYLFAYCLSLIHI